MWYHIWASTRLPYGIMTVFVTRIACPLVAVSVVNWKSNALPLIAYHLLFFFSLSRSLQRALDRRLYLLIYGPTYGAAEDEAVWHFPEKIYESEGTLRKVIFFLLVKLLIGSLLLVIVYSNLPVCRVCTKVCYRWPFQHILCWKCSNGTHDYATQGECQGTLYFEGKPGRS